MHQISKVQTAEVLIALMIGFDIAAAPPDYRNEIGQVQRASKLLGKEIKNGGGQSLISNNG